MKKIDLRPKVSKAIVTAAAGATFLAFSVSALANSFTIEFFTTTTKIIDLSIESIDKKSGSFEGEATSKNGLYEVAGIIKGDKVEIELVNTTGSERIILSGHIDKDGVITGRAASDAGELMEWETTDALVYKSTA